MTKPAKPALSPDPQPRWHLIMVNPRKETFALHHLKRNGHEAYLPMRLDMADRRMTPTPLFPGYLFVKVYSATEWWSIFTTMGVRSVVGTRDRPSPVKRGVVEAIQKVQLDSFVPTMTPAELDARFKADDEVTVLLGEAVLKAIFLEQIDAERCRVLVSLCGRDSRPVLPMSRVIT